MGEITGNEGIECAIFQKKSVYLRAEPGGEKGRGHATDYTDERGERRGFTLGLLLPSGKGPH